jgi:hypothetical protein
VSICETIPDSEFSDNYSDFAIGQCICNHGNYEEKFINFLNESDIGEFLVHDEALDWIVRHKALYRIRTDFGVYIKSSEWFARKKPFLDQVKKELRVVKRVMKD